jgi:hypothetical protein
MARDNEGYPADPALRAQEEKLEQMLGSLPRAEAPRTLRAEVMAELRATPPSLGVRLRRWWAGLGAWRVPMQLAPAAALVLAAYVGFDAMKQNPSISTRGVTVAEAPKSVADEIGAPDRDLALASKPALPAPESDLESGEALAFDIAAADPVIDFAQRDTAAMGRELMGNEFGPSEVGIAMAIETEANLPAMSSPTGPSEPEDLLPAMPGGDLESSHSQIAQAPASETPGQSELAMRQREAEVAVNRQMDSAPSDLTDTVWSLQESQSEANEVAAAAIDQQMAARQSVAGSAVQPEIPNEDSRIPAPVGGRSETQIASAVESSPAEEPAPTANGMMRIRAERIDETVSEVPAERSDRVRRSEVARSESTPTSPIPSAMGLSESGTFTADQITALRERSAPRPAPPRAAPVETAEMQIDADDPQGLIEKLRTKIQELGGLVRVSQAVTRDRNIWRVQAEVPRHQVERLRESLPNLADSNAPEPPEVEEEARQLSPSDREQVMVEIRIHRTTR